MTTYTELESGLLSDLNSRIEDFKDVRFPGDLIAETVDGWVPIYNYDLIECLASDRTLAEVDDAGLLPENPSVHSTISTAIYEKLSIAAHQWLSDNNITS